MDNVNSPLIERVSRTCFASFCSIFSDIPQYGILRHFMTSLKTMRYESIEIRKKKWKTYHRTKFVFVKTNIRIEAKEIDFDYNKEMTENKEETVEKDVMLRRTKQNRRGETTNF